MGSHHSTLNPVPVPTTMADAATDRAPVPSVPPECESATPLERAAKRPRRSETNDGGNADDGNVIARDGASPPTLSTMPPKLLVKILGFLAGEPSQTNLSPFLALDRTCRSLHKLLASRDETWGELFPTLRNIEYACHTSLRERLFITRGLYCSRKLQKSSDDIVLGALGRTEGLSRVVGAILNEMRVRPEGNSGHQVANIKVIFQGASDVYLTEAIQAHFIDRLEKAQRLALANLRPGDAYPELLPKHLTVLDDVTDQKHCSNGCNTYRGTGWSWPADNCSGYDILGADERSKLVRALAYRAGVVKMSGEAFSLVATEILRNMGLIVVGALVSLQSGEDELFVNDKSSDIVQNGSVDVKVGDLDDADCPPVQKDENGRLECVIVPAQIEDAAVRMGMTPVLGFATGKMERLEAASSEGEREGESGIDPVASNCVESSANGVDGNKMEAAASSGDYITAGFIQAEAKMSRKVSKFIERLEGAAKAAAEEEDYVQAGKLQQIGVNLENNRSRLRDMEKLIFEAATLRDFVKAGQLQAQYHALIRSSKRGISGPVTLGSTTLVPKSTQEYWY